MLTRYVNLTKLCLVKEIQYILSTSDEYKNNLVLQNSACRQQLTQYVLSNINHRYLKIENLSEIPKEASEILPQCPIDEQLLIRQLLETKILEIAQELLLYTEYKSA